MISVSKHEVLSVLGPTVGDSVNNTNLELFLIPKCAHHTSTAPNFRAAPMHPHSGNNTSSIL